MDGALAPCRRVTSRPRMTGPPPAVSAEPPVQLLLFIVELTESTICIGHAAALRTV
jgi:hypothetical protein